MPAQPPTSALRPHRALVVHRRLGLARRLLKVLHKSGCETEVVGDPLEGLRRFGARRFDLVVMDPEIEAAAPDAAELLYSQTSAPVLYICGDARPIGFRALARGIGFLVPPLDPAYMQALVKRALRGPGSMA